MAAVIKKAEHIIPGTDAAFYVPDFITSDEANVLLQVRCYPGMLMIVATMVG
jgi:hypothetical protein